MFEEIEGMCEVLGSSSSDCILANSLYELESYCTGVIARQFDGTIIHGRVMDFDFTDTLRKSVYTAEFYHGDQFLFHAEMFGGINGVYTGMRPNGFSITLNQRFPNKSPLGLVENLYLLFSGKPASSWLIRDTLTSCEDYSCAYD